MHSYAGQDAAFCINPTPSAGQSHGTQGLESTYGAAASIVVLLICVYYSAQIVLFGAEMTHVDQAALRCTSPATAAAVSCAPLWSPSLR